jgi:hypothetical protein
MADPTRSENVTDISPITISCAKLLSSVTDLHESAEQPSSNSASRTSLNQLVEENFVEREEIKDVHCAVDAESFLDRMDSIDMAIFRESIAGTKILEMSIQDEETFPLMSRPSSLSSTNDTTLDILSRENTDSVITSSSTLKHNTISCNITQYTLDDTIVTPIQRKLYHPVHIVSEDLVSESYPDEQFEEMDIDEYFHEIDLQSLNESITSSKQEFETSDILDEEVMEKPVDVDKQTVTSMNEDIVPTVNCNSIILPSVQLGEIYTNSNQKQYQIDNVQLVHESTVESSSVPENFKEIRFDAFENENEESELLELAKRLQDAQLSRYQLTEPILENNILQKSMQRPKCGTKNEDVVTYIDSVTIMWPCYIDEDSHSFSSDFNRQSGVREESLVDEDMIVKSADHITESTPTDFDFDCKFDTFDLQDFTDLRNDKHQSPESICFQSDELLVENVSSKVSRTNKHNKSIEKDYIYKDIGIVKCADIVQMKELLNDGNIRQNKINKKSRNCTKESINEDTITPKKWTINACVIKLNELEKTEMKTTYTLTGTENPGLDTALPDCNNSIEQSENPKTSCNTIDVEQSKTTDIHPVNASTKSYEDEHQLLEEAIKDTEKFVLSMCNKQGPIFTPQDAERETTRDLESRYEQNSSFKKVDTASENIFSSVDMNENFVNNIEAIDCKKES